MKYPAKDSLNSSFGFATARQGIYGVVTNLPVVILLGILSATSVSAVELVSINRDGTDSGSGYSSRPSISGDGRFIAFVSAAGDLVDRDSNGTVDVFVHDLLTGTTALVSVNSGGTDSANGLSTQPVISEDGHFVAYVSEADNLVGGDTNGKKDVFVRDLLNDTTTLVSIDKEGASSGAGGSYNPVISTDGRFLAFVSEADNLVERDHNGSEDVFVRDLMTQTTTLVSIDRDGIGSTMGYSNQPAISADGRFVAFSSSALNLVDTNINTSGNVFVRDLLNGSTTLVSVNNDGTGSGNYQSSHPDISADGRFIAFSSRADNLVDTDTNGSNDVFVRDLQSATTTLVSINREGTDSGNHGSEPPDISANGRFIAFVSEASDLVERDSNEWNYMFPFGHDVFVRDLLNETTTLVSVNREGTDSGNFESGYGSPAISADGRFVAFTSYSDDLVYTRTEGANDVFVRDLLKGTTNLVSINIEGTGADTWDSMTPVISADGRFIAFWSYLDNLVETDTNNAGDIFAFDVQKARLMSLNLDPRVRAGDKSKGSLTLSNPTPASGVLVSLGNSKPGVATLPDRLAIPAGSEIGTFIVNTRADICSTWVEISARGPEISLTKSLYIASDYTTSPTIPTGFRKFALKDKWLILSWNSMPNVEKYTIDRRRANRPWENIGQVAAERTAFMPPPQTPCVGYYYRLRAENPCGLSAAATIGPVYMSCPY